MAKDCPRANLEMQACKVVAKPPRQVGPRQLRWIRGGRYVAFGRPGPEWLVEEGGGLYAANEEAERACSMESTNDIVRQRVWQAAVEAGEGDESTCAVEDIERAMVIARELDAANEFVVTSEDIDRADAKAMRRAAKALKISRQKAKDTWYKVAAYCPEVL